MKTKNHRVGIRIATAAVFALLACLPVIVKGELQHPAPLAQPAVAASSAGAADACLDYTPAQATVAELAFPFALPEANVTAAAKPKPCQPCPNRPWCTCTYNGQPRISCDPCCYIQQYTGQVICLD